MKGGGGAIDLVMHVNKCDIEETNWQAVKKYLIGKRKLPSGLVDSWHNSGLIYVDEKQNAVFLRRSMDEEKITGANLRGPAGTDNQFKVLKPTVKCRQARHYTASGGQIRKTGVTKEKVAAYLVFAACLSENQSSNFFSDLI